MQTKKIKKLAEMTYSGNKINEKIVKLASGKLKKSELKVYLKSLKNMQKKKVLKVYVPSKKLISRDIENRLVKFFKNKELNFIEDKSLIAGIRVVDNDMIYELNLKDSFENLIEYIQRSYD